MMENTVAEERCLESECWNDLLMYMSILHNCRDYVNTYFPMMNNIVLAKLGQHVSSAIPLTWIAMFLVSGSVILYNT